MEMSRLTRDGAAQPVSRDQILRRERDRKILIFPCSADHEQDWQTYTRLIHALAICDEPYICIAEIRNELFFRTSV